MTSRIEVLLPDIRRAVDVCRARNIGFTLNVAVTEGVERIMGFPVHVSNVVPEGQAWLMEACRCVNQGEGTLAHIAQRHITVIK